MRDIKLLVADVDGTLVTTDKRLTARTRSAAHALRAHGIELAITSGRPPRGMVMLVEPLALTTPIAAFNGGMLVEPDLETILEQRTLPRAIAEEVLESLIGAGLDAWAYRGNDWFIRDRSAPHVAREQATVQFEPRVMTDLEAVLDDAVKIVGVSDDLDLVARMETRLRDAVGHCASVARSQPYYLDITHPDANKATVVRELSARLGIPLSQVAAIGDMPNDVLMFSQAGISIAMGNASRDVQRTARFVTTSNEDEGFANAVERILVGREQTLGLPGRVEACLFDLDGVVTRTAALHAEAWKRTFDPFLHDHAEATGEAFVPFDATTDYARYVDGKQRLDGVRAFLASRGIWLSEDADDAQGDGESVQSLADRKNALFTQLLRERAVATYPGSIRYVQAARHKGLKTAIVSSSRHTTDVLRSAGIADLFDYVIDGVRAEQQHVAGKPAPDTYLAAASGLHVEPARAAVFEDAIAGVEAGRAGHFGYVVGVDRLGQRAALREHGADVVVDDLEALLEAA